MSALAHPRADSARGVERDNGAPWRGLAGPAIVAIVAAAVVLGAVVRSSPSTWMLLGAGHGVVPEAYYGPWAFVLVLATTLGQAAGWAGGSGVAYYVATRVGFPEGAFTWKLAMSVVYAGLGAGPLLAFHVVFGRPLLGLPREGLAARLSADYPDAHRLLITLHPAVDWSVIPLAACFYGFLWLLASERSAPARYGVALSLMGTSLAVALSLAIHSTLVHLRF
jgi:hypothetical protein